MISEKSLNHKTKTVFNIYFIRKSCNFQKIVILKSDNDITYGIQIKCNDNIQTYNTRTVRISQEGDPKMQSEKD
jgi:hypothetical protein